MSLIEKIATAIESKQKVMIKYVYSPVGEPPHLEKTTARITAFDQTEKEIEFETSNGRKMGIGLQVVEDIEFL